MMEAIAKRKAGWLFDASGHENFSGKRRPQEDMVTSAVFGTIRLLPKQDCRDALDLLIGKACRDAAGFDAGADVEIELWRKLRLKGVNDRKSAEPDVLLTCGDKTVIVEVKWHAPLSERQIEWQIEAARQNGRTVVAAVMLGEAGVEDNVEGVPCFRRTWRDVSGDLEIRRLQLQPEGFPDTPFGRWAKAIHGFLRETDMGRVFARIAPVEHDPGAVAYRFKTPGRPPWFGIGPDELHDPDAVAYRFKTPGRPPWLCRAPDSVEYVHYRYGERK